jgi:hypothetical protein
MLATIDPGFSDRGRPLAEFRDPDSDMSLTNHGYVSLSGQLSPG